MLKSFRFNLIPLVRAKRFENEFLHVRVLLDRFRVLSVLRRMAKRFPRRTVRETFRGAKFSRDRDGIGRDRIGPRFGFENVYSHRSDRDVGESVRENFTDERVQTDIREQRRGESERVRGRDGEGRL